MLQLIRHCRCSQCHTSQPGTGNLALLYSEDGFEGEATTEHSNPGAALASQDTICGWLEHARRTAFGGVALHLQHDISIS